MRVLICGGGTAGHVIPAVAIGEIINRHFKDSVIAFAGRRGGSENAAYEKTGRRLYTLDICGFKRSLSINNIKTVFKVLKSSRNVNLIIKEFNPDLIIGTGGYVCFPFIRYGQQHGIPTVIHESNAFPGLVTRLLGKKCDKILLNIEETKKRLGNAKNAEVVGIPTLTEFGTLSKSEARRSLGIKDSDVLVVSFGGSLGATALNSTIAEVIRRSISENRNIKHVHSTGKSHYEVMKDAYPDLFCSACSAKILPYIENMPTLLTAADLAVTRSGAITISELCRSATPSILIPSPNVTANHQYKNAKHAESLGISRVIEEKDLSAELLFDTIVGIVSDKRRLEAMARAARRAYKSDSEDKIVTVIRNIVGKSQ